MERHGQATQLPYPPIRITKQNKSYAQAMLDNMGGRVSEILKCQRSAFIFTII